MRLMFDGETVEVERGDSICAGLSVVGFFVVFLAII